MKARTEEYVFHRLNDLQWRFGILEEGRSRTITNSEQHQLVHDLTDKGYMIVKHEDSGRFIVFGREVDVDLERDPDCQEV